jgi:hypothetical protein
MIPHPAPADKTTGTKPARCGGSIQTRLPGGGNAISRSVVTTAKMLP